MSDHLNAAVGGTQ